MNEDVRIYQRRMVEYTAHKVRYQDKMKDTMNQYTNLSKLCEGEDGR